MIRTFQYRAAATPTDVVVGEGALALLAKRLPNAAPGRWFVVTSRPVFTRHGGLLVAGVGDADVDPKPFYIPDGEKAKTWDVLGKLLTDLTTRGLKRDGGILALGGGTVGDVAGLAASLALRGVPVVQIPTTLLAAADSALGGKTAVDLAGGKNLVGTIHQPRLILVEPAVFATLEERDYRSGLAEVVKTSFLDAPFHGAMEKLEKPLSERVTDAVGEAVYRSLHVKGRFVEADPFETEGRRAGLNLGHTVGHALEAASGFRLSHGEAVAWGLLAILRLSVTRGLLAASLAEAMAARVKRLCALPPIPRAALDDWPTYLGRDKKSDRAGLRAVLLRGAGRTVLERVQTDELARALDEARKARITG